MQMRVKKHAGKKSLVQEMRSFIRPHTAARIYFDIWLTCSNAKSEKDVK